MTEAVAAVPTRSSPGLARAAAVLGATSAALHLLLLDPTSLASLVPLVVGLGCLPCSARLWRSPTRSAWGLAAALDATMLAVHLTAQAGPHAAHTAAPAAMAHTALAVVVGQLLLAGAALQRR